MSIPIIAMALNEGLDASGGHITFVSDPEGETSARQIAHCAHLIRSEQADLTCGEMFLGIRVDRPQGRSGRDAPEVFLVWNLVVSRLSYETRSRIIDALRSLAQQSRQLLSIDGDSRTEVRSTTAFSAALQAWSRRNLPELIASGPEEGGMRPDKSAKRKPPMAAWAWMLCVLLALVGGWILGQVRDVASVERSGSGGAMAVEARAGEVGNEDDTARVIEEIVTECRRILVAMEIDDDQSLFSAMDRMCVLAVRAPKNPATVAQAIFEASSFVVLQAERVVASRLQSGGGAAGDLGFDVVVANQDKVLEIADKLERMEAEVRNLSDRATGGGAERVRAEAYKYFVDALNARLAVLVDQGAKSASFARALNWLKHAASHPLSEAADERMRGHFGALAEVSRVLRSPAEVRVHVFFGSAFARGPQGSGGPKVRLPRQICLRGRSGEDLHTVDLSELNGAKNAGGEGAEAARPGGGAGDRYGHSRGRVASLHLSWEELATMSTVEPIGGDTLPAPDVLKIPDDYLVKFLWLQGKSSLLIGTTLQSGLEAEVYVESAAMRKALADLRVFLGK